MKPHIVIICQLAALALILGTVVALKASGVAINDVAALGLGVAIGNLTSGLTPGPSQNTTGEKQKEQ